MAEDIKENAMSGGTPARLRGLAANGNSISPTIQEVAETFGKGYAADLNNETDYGISGMFNADTINHPPISSDIIFGIYSNHRAKYITGGVFLYQIAVPENMIVVLQAMWIFILVMPVPAISVRTGRILLVNAVHSWGRLHKT